jgi:hypothetical protein
VDAAEKRAIDRLCEATGKASPSEAIVARSRTLLTEYGRVCPPFNPEQMAGLQKITRIDRCDIPFDACLVPSEAGFRIEVCKYHSDRRQNFSIAHEIGHTFLIEHEPTLGGARREAGLSSHSANSDLVEKLCDTAASELIWPAQTFERDAWKVGASLAAVVGLANLYRGSITATARRFADIGPWRCGFVIWEGAATGDSSVKLRPKSIYRSSCATLARKDQVVAAEGSQFYRALECEGIVKGRETIDSSGRRFYVETMKLGAGAISMIIMEPHAEILAAKKPRPSQGGLFR